MFNSNNSIWSGAYYTNPTAQYFSIQADWNVPGVFSLPNSPLYAAAAVWVGLDNASANLFQAGTDSEIIYLAAYGLTATNYWMWIESLPFAPWGLPNFPISPGDSVSVDIFVADQNGQTWFKDMSGLTGGGLTSANNSVWFMMHNLTKNLQYWGTYPTAPESFGGQSDRGFTGSSAEFILERPTVNGSAVPLACFALTSIKGCWYGDSNYGDRFFKLGPIGSTPFDGTLTYLNMTDPATNNLLAFPAALPDPTISGGYEIFWFWTNFL